MLYLPDVFRGFEEISHSAVKEQKEADTSTQENLVDGDQNDRLLN